MKIGQFTKSDIIYTGEVFSFGIRVRGVFIRPIDAKQSAKGPDFAITLEVLDMVTEIGAAWNKTSRDGKPYLSVRLDGPTMPTPVNCALVYSSARGYELVWTRDNRTGETSA